MRGSGGAVARGWRTVGVVIVAWLTLPAPIGLALAGPASAAPSISEPVPTLGALPPHDLSPLGMFLSADVVVKAVMIGLAFASVVTWTVWLSKSLELLEANRRLRRAIKELDRSASLQAVPQTSTGRWGSAAAFVRDATTEIGLSNGLPSGGTKERIASRFERTEAAANRRMTRGTSILATIGSTAPFVGLFGTVWGIMNSFVGIAKAQTSNLAVVAPGIAEALLATATGLVAAIPAVMIYNVFARAMTGHRALVADAAAATMRLASRDLDGQRAMPVAAE